MSKNSVVYVLIVAALLSAAAVSLHQIGITRAAGAGQADHSYDAMESLRSYGRAMPGWAASTQADRSYDAIESIRQSAAQGEKCPDGECSFQLSDGRWVR